MSVTRPSTRHLTVRLPVSTKLLLVRHFHLSIVHCLLYVEGALSLNGATNTVCCAQDLFDSARQGPSHGARPHDARDVDHFLKAHVAVVLDMLHLQAGMRGLNV